MNELLQARRQYENLKKLQAKSRLCIKDSRRLKRRDKRWALKALNVAGAKSKKKYQAAGAALGFAASLGATAIAYQQLHPPPVTDTLIGSDSHKALNLESPPPPVSSTDPLNLESPPPLVSSTDPTPALITDLNPESPPVPSTPVGSIDNNDPCNEGRGFLRWSAMSCYVDSLFVPFFYYQPLVFQRMLKGGNLSYWKTKNGELYTLAQQIQKTLQEIDGALTAGECRKLTELRSLIEKFVKHPESEKTQDSKRQNWQTDQMMPQDMYTMLSSILQVNDEDATIRTKRWDDVQDPSINIEKAYTDYYLNTARNPKITSVSAKSSASVDILPVNSPTNVREVFPIRYSVPAFSETRRNTKSIEITEISDTPYLIVWVNRLFGQITNPVTQAQTAANPNSQAKITMVKNDNNVVAPPQLELPNGKELSLVSVIVHQGGSGDGHYIAYIKCKTCPHNWFLYNDMLPTLTKKMESPDFLENDKVQKNGVMYLYMANQSLCQD